MRWKSDSLTPAACRPSSCCGLTHDIVPAESISCRNVYTVRLSHVPGEGVVERRERDKINAARRDYCRAGESTCHYVINIARCNISTLQHFSIISILHCFVSTLLMTIVQFLKLTQSLLPMRSIVFE